MHRIKRMPRTWAWGLVWIGLVLGAPGAGAQPPGEAAQPGEPAPPPRPVVIPGAANLVVVPINGTLRLQMKTKRPIRSAQNERENVALVTPQRDDPTAVLITGRSAGATRLTLTDVDGVSEEFQIVVQFDIELLKTLLQRAVPTANVVPIPGAGQSIILTGMVSRSEDVDIITRIAQTAVAGGPQQVINAMRVGGVMQVQLDVVIASVTRNEIRRMAFEFLSSGFQHSLSSGLGGLANASGAIGGVLPAFPVTVPNRVASAINGAPINLFAGIFTPNQDYFGFLQALRDEGVAKIFTQPRVAVLSGHQAQIVSGGETPVVLSQGLGAVSVQFRQFGTVVNVLPIVLGNGKIYLDVQPQVSQINFANGIVASGTVVPGFDVQSVQTIVEIEPGYTLAVGGLIEHRVQGTMRKVPILGDLPFLGVAFSSKQFNDIETELLFLVTPHLVDPMDCTQVPKLLPGQETRNPDDFEFFLENILEAPRGPRKVCHNRRYVPAFKNDPSYRKYPCGPGKYGLGWSGVPPACGPCGVGGAGCCGAGAGCPGGQGCFGGPGTVLAPAAESPTLAQQAAPQPGGEAVKQTGTGPESLPTLPAANAAPDSGPSAVRPAFLPEVNAGPAKEVGAK